jgi:hypothetical protein
LVAIGPVVSEEENFISNQDGRQAKIEKRGDEIF